MVMLYLENVCNFVREIIAEQTHSPIPPHTKTIKKGHETSIGRLHKSALEAYGMGKSI